MEVLVTLFMILLLSYLLSILFSKINLPGIISPIIIGAVFSVGIIRDIFINNEVLTVVNFIKDIAIIFMIFFVGLKIDLKNFKKSSRRSVYIALFASMMPFLLGFFGTYLAYYLGFLKDVISEQNLLIVSYIVGICISVTAEVVIIEILEELKILKSLLGETIIEAGLIDTVIGVIFISGLIMFLPSTGYLSHISSFSVKALIRIFEVIIFSAIIYILGKKLVPMLMRDTENEKNRNINFFTVSILITLFLAILSLVFDFGGSILGALFSGVIIRHTLLSGDNYEKREEYQLTEIIEVTTFGFFAIYFLFWIGLKADFSILFTRPFLAFYIVLLAFVGKYVGAYLGNLMAGSRKKEGHIIGWAMNTKGEVDIMIATLMFSMGVLNKEIFSSLIFMSFITTLISPIIFRYLVKKYHGL